VPAIIGTRTMAAFTAMVATGRARHCVVVLRIAPPPLVRSTRRPERV
jgi:hypothetical protein